VVVGLLGGCVVGAEEPTATIEIKSDLSSGDNATGVESTIAPERDPSRDVCGLAAQLATDDVCSLICDPTAMAAALVAQGMRSGTCYQLRCVLPDSSSVQVGVCLPPSP
jgi:hypothetical protein